MTQPLIEFKKVAKSFGSNVILEDMTFSVNAGETFCVIGGSGSGKSVSLKLLLGLLPIDSGQIFFKGQDITEFDERELGQIRSHFGMVFQGSALFDSMTVDENVAYPLYELDKYSDDEIKRIVNEKLKLVDLANTGELYPGDLSGGMKKRVGLARALATDPEVILYDEPTAGLDPSNVNRIDELILHLQKNFGVTSILVTHHMPSVYEVANRVGLLYKKRLGFIGTLEEFKNSTNPLVRKFVEGEIGNDCFP